MKIKNILIVGLFALAASSCNDYLEVEPGSKYKYDFVFSDKNEASRALNGVYAQLLTNDTYGKAYLSTFCLNSDVEMWISSNELPSNTGYRRFDCNSNGGDIDKFWTAAYRGIEYANVYIYNLENGSVFSKDDAEVMQMLGEAKVIRAMFYHDLVVMFGDIPFSFTPNSLAEDAIMPVTDRETIHKELIADLKEVAPYMELASALSDGVERISKEMCWSMIARMALTCGGYSLHPDKSNPRNYGTMERPDNYKEYYDIARQYCDSVINKSNHRLNLPYREVFINECKYIVTNNDDPIFEIPFAKNSSGNVGYIHGPKSVLSEGATAAPNIWGETKGDARLNAFYRFSFDENDLRRDYVNGLWGYEYDGTPTILTDYTVYNNKWSKLWSTQSLGNNSTDNTGINFPYMRYADVLLMYAEAVNEVEDGVSGPNGDKAVDALRQVRQRAFENPDETYITNAKASKETFLKAVLDERKWEFAGENMRWRDLVRNNLYSEVTYYNFLRYFAVAENTGGSSDYIDMVEEYDAENGCKAGYLNNLPASMYYQKDKANPNNINEYPNTALDVLGLYNPYENAKNPSDKIHTEVGNFYDWYNKDAGFPRAQCLYSFYGFMRGDDVTGQIYIVGNDGNVSVENGPDNLPVVRYILPYPRTVIQRSAGVYKNYYGYTD
nr:RagB/SusD family nutrient uptake outer membrane protein [uncultured Bacteroides sp.]